MLEDLEGEDYDSEEDLSAFEEENAAGEGDDKQQQLRLEGMLDNEVA